MNAATDTITLDIETYNEPCPQGTWPARLIDIVDVGEEESFGKMKRMIWLAWQVFPANEETGEVLKQSDGSPYVADKKYSRSLFPGNNSVQASGLFVDLDSWLAGKLSGGKLKKFTLNDLYNVPCLVTVEHKASNSGDNVYINVTKVEPYNEEEYGPAPEPDRENYTRADYEKRRPKPKAAPSVNPFMSPTNLSAKPEGDFVAF